MKAAKPAEIDDELATPLRRRRPRGPQDPGRASGWSRNTAAPRARSPSARCWTSWTSRWTSTCPTSLVKAEAEQIAHQLWHEDNPHEHGHNHEHVEPTEDHLRLAKRRVKLGLLLAELGQKAEVKVTDAELTQAVLQQARQYRGQERQFFEYVQQNAAARQQLQAPIFEDKVIDHIFAQRPGRGEGGHQGRAADRRRGARRGVRPVRKTVRATVSRAERPAARRAGRNLGSLRQGAPGAPFSFLGPGPPAARPGS